MQEFFHPELRRVLREIQAQYCAINEKEDAIMSGLDDLTANVSVLQDNVAALTQEQATFITDIQAALAANAGDSDAAVEAVAQLVATQAQNVAALTSAQQAADPAASAVPSAD